MNHPMFNADFDPFEELAKCQHRIEALEVVVKHLAENIIKMENNQLVFIRAVNDLSARVSRITE